MFAVTDVMLENPLAAAFGAAGLFNQLLWPLLKLRRSILIAQFGVGADYGAHYALLGAWSGAGVACLGALQTAAAYFAVGHPWVGRIAPAFVAAVIAVCCVTWEGLESFLALAACTLTMVGRMRRDTLALRGFLLSAAPFGIAYDLAVGALPAMLGGVISATVSAVMLVRELRARRAGLRPGVA